MIQGKTAVYTILKNEINNIDRWLYYAEPFDYRVLLDTGSTDGSYEILKAHSEKDKNLIVEQQTFTPWHFSMARNYNLSMIPNDVTWCLSPDLDEYFSINTHNEMEKIISAVPSITNISCDRLDIYSPIVRIGPPNHIPSNKIHRKNDYKWVQPIYEHLRWIHIDCYENELYSDDIFLIHDQDFRKKERSELYFTMLEAEYKDNPTNTWCLWFLLIRYQKLQKLNEYILAACDFVLYHTKNDDWYNTIYNNLRQLYTAEPTLTDEQREYIKQTLSVEKTFI